jgi:hypothetical protein
MDFMVILPKLKESSWSYLKKLSDTPIWRYIIEVPLVLFCSIGEILLSRELVPRDMICPFATCTTIRIGESRRLTSFLLREYGMPLDLRHVMRYFGYSGTPLFAAYLQWNEGRDPSFSERIKTLFIEGCQSLALAKSDSNKGYTKKYVQSYLATYMLHFRRYRIEG